MFIPLIYVFALVIIHAAKYGGFPVKIVGLQGVQKEN